MTNLAYFETWFVIFFFYCLVGRIFENLYVAINRSIRNVKSDQPLFQPPSIPLVYGLGCIAMIFGCSWLKIDHQSSLFLTFIACFLIGGTVEWLSATFLVLVFGKNIWWDYTNVPYNFQGKICLLNCLLFGIGGTIVVRYLQPIVLQVVQFLSQNQIDTLATFALIALIIDNLYAIYIHLKNHDYHRFNYLEKKLTTSKTSKSIKSKKP